MNKPNLMESVQPCSGQYSFKADLRLNAWFFVAAVVWMVDLVLLKRHPEWTPLEKSLLELTPLIPGLLYIRNGLRFIRGLDELQRRIQQEAWLFVALGTVIVSTGITILNAHDVQLEALKHGLGLGGTFGLMFTLWLVGSAIANRRYK